MARNWRQFPPEYARLLHHFENSKEELSFEMEARKAQHIRRDMYRFGLELGKAASSNDEARHLEVIYRRLVFSIVPGKAMGEQPAKLVIRYNEFLEQVDDLLGPEEEEPVLPETKEEPEKGAFDIAQLEAMIAEMEEEDG